MLEAAQRMTRVLLLAGLASAGVPTPAIVAQTQEAALFQDLVWRNIGPANMAGRVTDIEAVEEDFSTVFVASASGGVWKSVNAGTTWLPVFEDYGSASIGDIALFQPDPDIVWVGTGESCTRNSVGWGDGVYKSTDGGESFVNVGLKDTHHIGEVVVHPSNADIVYVAAQGHLWGHSGERGIFKTTDGGETWRRLAVGLPDDGRTGATDLKMDPSNPEVLYAAFWERLRQPHRFDSGGPGGGIFKSTDGGETWTRLTAGLPEGPTGKVGLAVYRRDPRIVMAIIEHGFQPEPMVDGRANPEYEDMSRLGTGIYRSEDGGESWEYVNRHNNRPFYYSHIYIDPSDDQLVYVLAGSAELSEDGGRTFSRSLEGISGDFHALWIHPSDGHLFYVGNDKGSYVTFDRGVTFQMFDNMDIGQFYAVTADSRDPYWVYGGLQDNGNWGGPSNSRDWNGILNDHWFKFHSGDGFHTTVDPNDWRTVYTERQGGNISRLDAVFRQVGKNITPNLGNVLNLREHYPELVEEPRPEARGGRGGLGGARDRLPREYFRFNWSSPLVLSPHDSRVVLFGGNRLFKSTDRGDTWRIISPDLSTARPELVDPESGGLTRDVTGAETHATLITISESPITPGLIWVGTDDGNVQITRDDGRTWTNVRPSLRGMPDGLWVSRVEASRFHEGTAYVSFDGHRSDDFRPWVFRTRDYGQSWENIGSSLPDGHAVYVIREDLRNADLLFVGTEFAVFASVDGGESWGRLVNGLPTVAIHDLVIHPREGDLIAATHGRSLWILDDITPLQQLTDEVRAAEAHLFGNRTATLWKGVSRGATRGHKLFMGRNPLTMRQVPPGNSPQELENSASVNYYLRDAQGGPVSLEISDVDGERVHRAQVSGEAGIHRYLWNLRFDPSAEERQAQRERMERLRSQFGDQIPDFAMQQASAGPTAGPGTYRVRLTVGGRTYDGTVAVREDPALGSVSEGGS
jgi:photosystem II stability/assembly factor-like uncharacterized protein